MFRPLLLALAVMCSCGLVSTPRDAGGGAGGGSAGGAGGAGGGFGGGPSDAGWAFLQWELDGGVVARLETFEAAYKASTDSAYVFLPWQGRNVQIQIQHVSDAGMVVLDCGSTSFLTLGVSTHDTMYTGLEGKLPPVWRGLTYSGCNNTSGDTVEFFHVEVRAHPERLSGAYEARIRGGGPRTGTTLRALGMFDVVPSPQ